MRRAALLLLFGLSACGTQSGTRPDVLTGKIVVHVPVPVSCVPKDFPPPPTYPDTRTALIKAPDAVSRTRLVYSGWGERDVRLRLLESTLSVCQKAAPPPQ
ncbi:MAG: hypothetical protein KGR26_13300 [Cyanobacteria bacterium REEB65]|nr:hypothetical protein [Cyanobacteria bacterium REEB65]